MLLAITTFAAFCRHTWWIAAPTCSSGNQSLPGTSPPPPSSCSSASLLPDFVQLCVVLLHVVRSHALRSCCRLILRCCPQLRAGPSRSSAWRQGPLVAGLCPKGFRHGCRAQGQAHAVPGQLTCLLHHDSGMPYGHLIITFFIYFAGWAAGYFPSVDQVRKRAYGKR